MKNSLSMEIFPRKLTQWKSLLLIGLFFSEALMIQTASAQTGVRERWFQVEMIAFARQAHDQQEHFLKNIKLSYPLNWVELKDSSTQGNTVATGGSESNTPANLANSSFYLLPQADRSLNRHATALGRDSRYRVLFHQAWRQPVTSLRSAPAILIRGGAKYGNHNELEGSITLSLSQLLQINTQLWLTQFEVNYGQTPGDWPSLPTQPQRLKAAFLEEVRNAGDAGLIPENPNQWSLDTTGSPETNTEITAAFLPQRIVLMKEERKMRSNELHYIDHPLFGLIIQLTPYDVPAEVAGQTN